MILTLALSLAIAGCANAPGGRQGAANGGKAAPAPNCSDPGISNAERVICEDNATFNKTMLGGAATGAVAGAALGALGCWAAGQDPLQCAAIGAVAGGVAGGIDGYVTAKEQEASRQNIRAIDAITNEVETENNKLARNVAAAKALSLEGQERLAKAQENLKSGQINATQAEAERASVMRSRQQLDTMISNTEKQRQQFAEAQPKTGESSNEFEAQMITLSKNIARLKQQRDKLNESLQVRTS
jgi:hypothetical protein